MATRFNFSTRDLLWATTLTAVVLGFFVRDVQRQKQAKAEIDDVKRDLGKHIEHLEQHVRSMTMEPGMYAHTKKLWQEEIKEKDEQIEQLRKQINK